MYLTPLTPARAARMFDEPACPYPDPIPIPPGDAEAVALSLLATAARIWIASKGPVDFTAEAPGLNRFVWAAESAYFAVAADAPTVGPVPSWHDSEHGR